MREVRKDPRMSGVRDLRVRRGEHDPRHLYAGSDRYCPLRCAR